MTKSKRRGSGTFLIGRDARTGEFVPTRVAHKTPGRYVIERIPKDNTNMPRSLQGLTVRKSTRK